jgi:putative transposase
MKRSRLTEERIIGILREQKAGVRTAVVCRKTGISEAMTLPPTFIQSRVESGG